MFRFLFISLFALNTSWALDTKTGPFYSFDGQKIKLDPYVKVIARQIDNSNKEQSNLAAYPEQVDLRELQSVVKNQGDRGSCGFFATNALIESLIKKNQKIEINLSEEYLIWKVKVEYGLSPTSDGSFAYQNVKGATKAGFVLERDFPYEPSWFNKGLPCAKYSSNSAPISCYTHNQPSSEVVGKVIPSDILVPQIYETPSSTKIIEIMANNQQPVIVGVPVNPDGWDEKTGVAVFNEQLSQDCDVQPGYCGGHAITLTGYNKTQRIFTFKNSWGATWGVEGYGTLSFDYIDRYAHNKMVTASLRGQVNIPSDYDQAPERILDVLGVNTSFQDSDLGKVANVQIQAKAQNLNNHIFYSSLFLVAPKNVNEPVSDINSFLVPVLTTYQKQYGTIVRDGVSQLFKLNEVQADINANLSIPLKIADLTNTSAENLFLRISTYYYSDIEGWKTVTRSYDPAHF